MKIVSILFFFTIALFANFEDGKKVFDAKCSSCHKEYIPMNLLKENFLEKNNTLLNLKAPSANLIVWAMFDSSKKIGDENDKEFQEIEINGYLKSYLENPDRFNSICDDSALGHYENKSSMKGVLSEDDYMNLTTYFMEFKNNIKEEDVYKKPKYSKEEEQNILTKAKNENKKIIVYATSKNCVFCKKMKKEVLDLEEIQSLQDKDYIFLEVDVDYIKLPFGVTKYYQQITPTFFFLDNNGKFQNAYPGSWNKSDYIEILKENL